MTKARKFGKVIKINGSREEIKKAEERLSKFLRSLKAADFDRMANALAGLNKTMP